MNLDALLRKPEWTEQLLAERSGTKQPTINRLRHNKINASLDLCLDIEHGSGGLVKAHQVPCLPATMKRLRRLARMRRR